MKTPFRFQFRCSIKTKLLLLVLPLVCIPIVIVGFLTYKASIASITRLSRKSQMLQAEVAASQVNSVFQFCCRDLETLAGVLLDDWSTTGQQLNSNPVEREKWYQLLEYFKTRFPAYHNIRYLDLSESQLKKTANDLKRNTTLRQQPSEMIFTDPGTYSMQRRNCQVSNIIYSRLYQGYMVSLTRTLTDRDGKSLGRLIMDLNFDKIIQRIRAIQSGKKGFAFMVDQSGRTIVHPVYKPYEYDLSKYDDPQLREFVVDMIMGETGWRTYNYFGEKATAFAPVTTTGWSLAVTIPIEEFKAEASAIWSDVLNLMIVMLVVSVLFVSLASHELLKPIKRLVHTTEKAAAGDLQQEIPVRSKDELGTLTHSFNRMIRNLRDIQTELIRSEKLIAIGKLSAGVAHEVRNPLNAMKGAIIYLRQCNSEDQQLQEYTQIILEEIHRLDDFVTRILFFAKQPVPIKEPTDINLFIKNIMNFLHEELKSSSLQVETQIEPALPPVLIDPQQMEQVILNLFSNAIQAMPGGGSLVISAGIKTEHQINGHQPPLIISFRDSGNGISRENLEKIFDPFYSTKPNGTGLGLPISLRIIEDHGGTMRIFSQEHKGSSVIIELPVH